MVPIPFVILAAALAFILGVIVTRRKSGGSTVVWEAPPSGAAYEAAAADPQLRTLLEQKQLIGAIKRYRELTGAGLKESKEAVEAMQRSSQP